MRSTTAISAALPRTTTAARSASRRIAAALSEPRDAIEEIVEPYLLQQGFIGRTPRGRVLTLKTYRHLGVGGPARSAPRTCRSSTPTKTRLNDAVRAVK